MSRFLRFIFIGNIFFCFLPSCRSLKKTPQNNTAILTVSSDSIDETCKLDFKSGRTLERMMKQHEIDFRTFNGKINCEVNSDKEENTFNISVRCRRDSVIWMNISKMGIDALRMLITKDSVKFMIMTSLGGMDKGYFKGDFSYINHLLNADVDYDMLQALLVGNSADFVNDSVKMKGGKDKEHCRYYLSTVRKRKLNKINEGKDPKDNLQAIWINPISWKILALEFIDIETNRRFHAVYNDFQAVGSNTIPFRQSYSVKAEKTINVELNYSKFSIDESISFPYKIPTSYQELIFNEKK